MEESLSWFIVLVVVLLAIAPLLHFLPSKRQRHQARLREAAALAGLHVEFRDLPLAEPRLARMPAAERQVLYYGCRFRSGRGDRPERCAWFREHDEWRSLPPRREPPKWLGEAPATVLAVGVSGSGCGIYWREEGDEHMVEELAKQLLLWRDQLVP